MIFLPQSTARQKKNLYWAWEKLIQSPKEAWLFMFYQQLQKHAQISARDNLP